MTSLKYVVRFPAVCTDVTARHTSYRVGFGAAEGVVCGHGPVSPCPKSHVAGVGSAASAAACCGDSFHRVSTIFLPIVVYRACFCFLLSSEAAALCKYSQTTGVTGL